MKKSFCVVLFLFLFALQGIAQVTSNEESSSDISLAIKMSGLSPAVGGTYQVGDNSQVRALGFFSINSLRINDNYLLDISYFRNTDWITSENINSYFGINLSMQFDNPVIGPGLLIGSSYNLDDQFAIFGEAGFNVFVFDDGDNAEVGMLNSGIGIQVGL